MVRWRVPLVLGALVAGSLGACSSGAGDSVEAGCEPGEATAPSFPIPQPAGDELVSEDFLALLTGWHYTEDRVVTTPDGANERTAAELSGGEGGVHSLNFRGERDWNEFLWDDPEWSERNDREDWMTRTEPGAFEPPYRFSYFTQLSLMTGLIGGLADQLVFEGTAPGGRLRYCVGGPQVASIAAAVGGEGALEKPRLRVLVDPTGYVAEFVVDDATSTGFCWEGSLEISESVDVPGRRSGPPAAWFTTLDELDSCQVP